jgi:hypothetical protein
MLCIKQKAHVTNIFDPGSKIFSDLLLHMCTLKMYVGSRSIHWWNAHGSTLRGKELR